ncbi:hypothetical protein [Sphingobacterium sp. CZ-UAM]|nr:hypothetical protein [Sphingobacterium sp. CZ-UAM]
MQKNLLKFVQKYVPTVPKNVSNITKNIVKAAQKHASVAPLPVMLY